MTKKSGQTKSAASRAITGDLMLAPMVVAMRMPVMLAEAAKGSISLGETRQAVNEKMQASVDGVLASQTSLAMSLMDFWPKIMAGHHPGGLLANSVVDAGHAALKPASHQVRRNFDRLRKF